MQNFYQEPVHDDVIVPLNKKKYGVSERKKAEIDALELEVINAQFEVDQFQAMVDSLTEKVATFTEYLSVAEANQATALNNKNLVDAVVMDAIDLLQASEVAFDGIVAADLKIGQVAAEMKDVIDKLIFALEIINRVNALVNSKKALNPIISDELVKTIGEAATNGNIAVTNCLVALQSCYVASTTGYEAEYASSLEVEQAQLLIATLLGHKNTQSGDTNTSVETKRVLKQMKKGVYETLEQKASLYKLLREQYAAAVEEYQFQLIALTRAEDELDDANNGLSAATVNLEALQRALAAANAAALAS